MRAKRVFNTSVLLEKGCYFLFYFILFNYLVFKI
jgi:hypothetical protein